MAKPKVWKTLAEETFDWIENQKQLKMPGKREVESKYEKGRRKQHWYQIRETAKKEIEDLKRLADVLPEDQQQQIFNEKNLSSPDEKGRPSLLRALFSFSEEHGVHEEGQWIRYAPDAVKRKERVLELSCNVITLLNNPLLSRLLAPAFHGVTNEEGGALPHLRAVHYASLRQAQEQSLAQARKSPKHAPDDKPA